MPPLHGPLAMGGYPKNEPSFSLRVAVFRNIFARMTERERDAVLKEINFPWQLQRKLAHSPIFGCVGRHVERRTQGDECQNLADTLVDIELVVARKKILRALQQNERTSNRNLNCS
jgi:hypothetical protein